jgi:hypothetical protein
LIGYGRRRIPEMILTTKRKRKRKSKSHLSFDASGNFKDFEYLLVIRFFRKN